MSMAGSASNAMILLSLQGPVGYLPNTYDVTPYIS